MVFWGYLISFLYAAGCILLAEIAKRIGMSERYTRKLVHILVGLEWLILYTFVGTSYHFLIICLLFLCLLFVIYKKSLVPSIASSGDNAPGTVYYAVAMSIMSALTLFDSRVIMPFGIGVICTSLGDGLAGVVGQLVTKHNLKIYKNKTVFGAISNLLFTFCGVLVFKNAFKLDIELYEIFFISLLSAGVELVSDKGVDNISATLSTSFFAYLLLFYENAQAYVLPIIITPFVFAFANKKRALTKGGLIAALALDLIISVSLGNFGFTMLFAFFILGIIGDKIAKKRKENLVLDDLEEKGSSRDFMQVLANGGVAAVLALVYLFYRDNLIIVMFAAALAEALADTFASSFGVYSKHAFDLFRLRRCKVGESGGMSLLGTALSVFGAFIISAVAFLFGKINYAELLIVSAAGFLGATLDSLFGSLLQAKYLCAICGKDTEKREHCDTPTVRKQGIKIINNDIVNLLSTLSSAILALIFYLLII